MGGDIGINWAKQYAYDKNSTFPPQRHGSLDFHDAFPIFKAMMKSFGLCESYVASPMMTVSSSELKIIENEVLEKFGIYKN